jgi:transposase-like protein
MNCKYCNGESCKQGFNNGIQKYRCKVCKKYFQSAYTRKRHNHSGLAKQIISFNNESVSIRGISKIIKDINFNGNKNNAEA